MSRSACVVGAGPAGLVTARMLRDEGFEVCVFERAEQVGGLWILRQPGSEQPSTAMYSHLCTNLPGPFMAFSDHPFPLREELFPSHEGILKYLSSYAETFELKPLIRFNSEVVDAQWDEASDLWLVQVQGADGTDEWRHFSRLAVCNGHYNTPIMPELRGSDAFPGVIEHSYDLFNASDYAGKSVLIIGSNVSAGDVASMLIRRAPGCAVHLSARSPPTAIGRAQVGPALKLGARIHGGLEKLTSRGTAVLSAPLPGWAESSSDGSSEVSVDVVLCATGYAYSFPFLRHSGLEQELCGDGTSMRRLYRRVLHTSNPSLAIIGTPNTLIPPWIVFEEQARWVAKVWSGAARLPSQVEMESEARARDVPQPAKGEARDHLGFQTPSYCNELATLSGSEGYYSVLLRSKVWRMLATKILGPGNVPEPVPQRAML